MKKDITQLLGRVRNRVQRVGIELEGGWLYNLLTNEGHRGLVHDGSVRFPESVVRTLCAAAPGSSPRRLTFGLQTGEAPSPILSMSEWRGWVKQNYPSAVNETCGMHIHMSFRNLITYMRTMEAQLGPTMITSLTQWAQERGLALDHPLWGRLRGDNEYCRTVFDADSQVRATSKSFNHNTPGNRYTALNYCFGTHETLECRVLPMFETSDLAISALQRVIDTTNAFLVLNAKREQPIIKQVLADEEYFSEEIIQSCV